MNAGAVRARAARPTRAAAPAVPPYEQLDATHRRVLELIDQLDALVEHLEANGPDDEARAIAKEVHTFFAQHARQHHADEEKYIFPPLLNSGNAELVNAVQRLQQDHGWLEEDWLELAPQIEAVAGGYNWYDVAMLRIALPVFRALYEEHIGLEESLVYPEAKQRIAALDAGSAKRQG